MNLLLQEFAQKEWGGLTTKNHLGYFYLTKPQKASDFMTYIWQSYIGYADLDSILNQFPTLMLDRDDEFEWDIMADGDRAIPLVGAYIDNVALTATDKAGVAHSQFQLEFGESYFFDTDLIVGHKEEYQIRILDDPKPNGTNWLYECELMSGDSTAFVPYSELLVGKKFSQLFAPVETYFSKKGTMTHYTSPTKMKNTFTRIRMEEIIPGNMVNREPWGVKWKDKDTGKVLSAWQDYREWKFEWDFRRQKNNMLYYSRLNKSADGTFKQKGKSGVSIEMGAGIRQQIESGNKYYYPTEDFDIDWLFEVMLDLSENKLPHDKRKFLLRTGERGLLQFSTAIRNHAQLYTFLRDSSMIKNKDGKMSFGGQFIEFIGPNGIEITVEHDKTKDDPVLHKIKHPNGGVAESYVYDLLDIGTSDGRPNIQKVAQKGMEDIKGYEPGLRNPFAMNERNPIMSTSTDGYKFHRMFIGGAIVYDPTRCLILKPQILR